MNNFENTPLRRYSSLEEIRNRKDELRKELYGSQEKINTLWSGLFERPKKETLTPSRRLSSLISSSANVLDAVILGWKLYHKFGKKNTPKKKRRR